LEAISGVYVSAPGRGLMVRISHEFGEEADYQGDDKKRGESCAAPSGCLADAIAKAIIRQFWKRSPLIVSGRYLCGAL
jgi:hypothetical protein